MGNPPKVHRLKLVKAYDPLAGRQMRVSVCGREFIDNRLLTVSPRSTECKYCRHHQVGLKGLPRQLPLDPSAVLSGSEKLLTYAHRTF